jgi:anti-sigma factor ChrR (cupin superfamily)
MISEQQQEQASLYVAGALPEAERSAFEADLRGNAELGELTRSLQRAIEALAIGSPPVPLPRGLKDKVLRRIDKLQDSKTSGGVSASAQAAGLRFIQAADKTGWKALPVPGAYIKLLSVEKERGYAVLLGKLDPGVRYPAHINSGPEDFYVLTGDLVVGDRKLVAGDFHHAEKGSQHSVNYSMEGCTLLAVLTAADPLVAFAMA